MPDAPGIDGKAIAGRAEAGIGGAGGVEAHERRHADGAADDDDAVVRQHGGVVDLGAERAVADLHERAPPAP